ncbi:MAG: GPW/gp25 family protein [Cytophagales bacterium]|nr:GPW/gp25 family protein [Cytophagales bacterium]
MEDENTFLGRGWAFPPTFTKEGKSLYMVEEEKDIEQSLHILLSTLPGERPMNPEYGCDLKALSFSGLNSLTINTIKDLIRRSILKFEPRISLEEILVEAGRINEGVLLITLHYTIRKINIRTNMVYPFYLKEGTNIRSETIVR